jgi:3-hydroxyisobutyrate dehydrogenase-like beta-hydroxyacid dehydrogenase
VEVCARALDAVEPGSLVLSCLSADDALDAVFGDGRVFERMGEGSVHLSMTTCRPDTQRRLADALALVGGAHVSAPLLGRPDLVKAKKHSVLLSGLAEAKARAEPVLSRLSARRFDFGEAPEAAAVVKLSTNHLIAAAIQSMAEAIAVAEKNGVDAAAMHRMWTETIFGSVVHQGYGRAIVDRSYTEPLFELDLGLKDVRLAKALGEESGAALPTAEVLERELRAAVDEGLSSYDWTGVADRSFARAGLPTASAD